MIKNSKSIILIENQWNFDCIVESKSNTQISKSRKNVSIAIIQNMISKNAKTKKIHYFWKVCIRFRNNKKLNDLIIFNQIDITKNLLTNNHNDDEFFSTNFNNVINKRRRKKFRMIKCDKIKIKINDIEIFAIINSKTKINLINNVFVKKFKLILFDVSFCEITTFDNNQFKIYEIYFVSLEISNENDVNRFVKM